MGFENFKAMDRNGFTMEWMKLKRLGKGSYGVVDLAMPMSIYNGRSYAVKSCPYQESTSVQKELKILTNFKGCRNIVQCCSDMFSFDQTTGKMVYHIVLEYAPGGTLLDLINKKYGGKLPEKDAKFYTKMLLEGIVEIHKKGYVHCDLKPENILVFPCEVSGCTINTLKIADFGVAREEPCTAKFPGTATYMPPESIMKITSGLDIWSLGCIVLQMITGKLPWECKNKMELATKIANHDHPMIPETISSLGKDFLMKCFRKNPNERWTAELLLGHPFILPDYVFDWTPFKPLFHVPLRNLQTLAL